MMRNILFVFAFCLIAGMVPAHAMQMEDATNMNIVTPYPPVVSPALDSLPEGFDTIFVGDETFYYSNGVFYQKIVRDNKYIAVPPPIGAVVHSIPDGYEYMTTDNDPLYVVGNVYYVKVLEGYKVVPAVII